jgi:hypothetical protein
VNTTGCRCQECYTLHEYLADAGLNTRGLPAAPGHTDTPATLTKPCTNEMTCDCEACHTDRANQQARTRRHPARQPWQPATATT